MKDNQVYIIKFSIKRAATVLKCLNLTRDGLIHVGVRRRLMCGTGIQFHVYVRLPIIYDKYKSYEMWFLKESLGGVVRVLVCRRPAGSEVRLTFLYVLWFSSFVPNKNWGSSPNRSVVVCG